MAENKTVKYHIPHRGIYMYSHVHEGKTVSFQNWRID